MVDKLGIEKVKIFQRDMTVEYSNKLGSDRNAWGECSYVMDTITLTNEVSTSAQASVLLHEMLHASLQLLKSELNEEQNVKLIECIFATLIKDNKEAFKTIIEKL